MAGSCEHGNKPPTDPTKENGVGGLGKIARNAFIKREYSITVNLFTPVFKLYTRWRLNQDGSVSIASRLRAVRGG
jgi:hypothetical protein